MERPDGETSEDRNYGRVPGRALGPPRPRTPNFDNKMLTREQRMFYARLRLHDKFARTQDQRVLEKLRVLG